MSYQIHYQISEKRKTGYIRLQFLSFVCFLFFCAMVHYWWPEGADYIDRKLFFLKDSAAVMALDQLADSFFGGEPLTAVFSIFTRA